jgi:hypothetical protein
MTYSTATAFVPKGQDPVMVQVQRTDHNLSQARVVELYLYKGEPKMTAVMDGDADEKIKSFYWDLHRFIWMQETD